ncbi:MAG: glutamyl-tRNA reductase [Planctomycetota bacterium]
MKITVTGLNHKSAPLDVRERLAFDSQRTLSALAELTSRFHDTEFVLLSTCNRVELYSAGKTKGDFKQELIRFFSDFHDIPCDVFSRFMYFHTDAEAVRHLLTVGSSLDSMVVGEYQILSQIKDSYRLACSAESTGKILNRLFHYAFSCSKKIRAATFITAGRISVAGVAVDLARQLFENIKSANVVVIGAGRVGELILQHLVHESCRQITVVNRSYDHAVSLARRYDVIAAKWDDLFPRIIEADILIASAAAAQYLLEKADFSRIMKKRKNRPMLAIDVAVPRNLNPAINSLEDVYLYSIDDLSEVAQKNRGIRRRDIARGMEIIDESVTEFMDWFTAEDIGPLIGRMKHGFRAIARNELQRFFAGSRHDAPRKKALEVMVDRIVNKLLHCVIRNVDSVNKKHGAAEAARLLDGIAQQAEELNTASIDRKNGKQ